MANIELAFKVASIACVTVSCLILLVYTRTAFVKHVSPKYVHWFHITIDVWYMSILLLGIEWILHITIRSL